VGNFGSNLRMDYTIIGREVNLAARLEQAAEPGGILMSRDTHDLVQDEIEVDAREPVVAKGFAEPITVYAVRHPGGAAPRRGGGDPCDRPGCAWNSTWAASRPRSARTPPPNCAGRWAAWRRSRREERGRAGPAAGAPASRLAAVQAADAAGSADVPA
jgi:adenylate cyclase